MVPDDWKVETLGELVSFISGGTPSKSRPEFWGGEVPWITAKDMKSFSLADSIDKITAVACEDGTKVVPAGTILLLTRGMGLLKDIPLGVASRQVAFNQDVKGLTSRPDVIAEFLAHALKSQKSTIMRMVTLAGHGTGRLETESIAALSVLVPPIQEQRAIVSLIGLADGCVEKVERLLSLKRTLKCGLMQELLTGKRRNSRFCGGTWKTYRLGELFVERVERNRPDLELLSITSDRGVMRREDTDRKDSSSEDKSPYKRIVPGDIGYNTMRMWQGVSALSYLEGIVSPAYTVCKPNGRLVDGEFVAQLFKLPSVVQMFHRYSQGLVNDTLALKFPNFAKIIVNIPQVEEQLSISNTLRIVDREIRLLEKQLNYLRLQKTGLAAKLLTGQIRTQSGAAFRVVGGGFEIDGNNSTDSTYGRRS
jgi:type I restriction enzyme, S subunit